MSKKPKSFLIEFVDLPKEFESSEVFSKFQTYCFDSLMKTHESSASKLALELSLVFITSGEMKALNLEFRGQNKVTDVLSFESPFETGFGELVFCLDVMEKQAVQNNWSLEMEWCWLFLHGVLHLLGYDHEADKEAQVMFKLQEDLFFSFFNT